MSEESFGFSSTLSNITTPIPPGMVGSTNMLNHQFSNLPLNTGNWDHHQSRTSANKKIRELANVITRGSDDLPDDETPTSNTQEKTYTPIEIPSLAEQYGLEGGPTSARLTSGENIVQFLNQSDLNTDKILTAFERILDLYLLGGLSRVDELDGYIDIVKARNSLCILLRANDRVVRSVSLEILSQLLEFHSYNMEETLAFNLSEDLKTLSAIIKEQFHDQTRSLQIKFANAFGHMAELLQRHQEMGHIHAMRDVDKLDLLAATKVMDGINTKHDLKLDYYISFARNATAQITTDVNVVMSAADRLAHLAKALAGAYTENAAYTFMELEAVFSNISARYTENWYKQAYKIKTLIIDACKNEEEFEKKFEEFLTRINKKIQVLDWKFAFCITDIFGYLVQRGGNSTSPDDQSESLKSNWKRKRLLMLKGAEIFGQRHYGLKHLAELDLFKIEKGLLRALQHGKTSHEPTSFINTNPNEVIRANAIEHLQHISLNSEHDYVRLAAKKVLLDRLDESKEKSGHVRQLLKSFVPPKHEHSDWINEIGKHVRNAPTGFDSFIGHAQRDSNVAREVAKKVSMARLRKSLESKVHVDKLHVPEPAHQQSMFAQLTKHMALKK